MLCIKRLAQTIISIFFPNSRLNSFDPWMPVSVPALHFKRIIEISFTCKFNSFPCEWLLCTRTRFDREALSNSEIDYCTCSLWCKKLKKLRRLRGTCHYNKWKCWMFMEVPKLSRRFGTVPFIGGTFHWWRALDVLLFCNFTAPEDVFILLFWFSGEESHF